MTADRFASLGDVEAEVVDCRACPRLVTWREQVARDKRRAFEGWDYWGRPVPGFGDPDAGVVVVGLAPAAHGANRTGRMFTGDRSGDWLFASLHRTGFANQPRSIDRDDGLRLTGAWVTSPVKCAPPANKPTTDERDRCAPYLTAELGLLPWRVIVALGGFGWDAVLGHLGWDGTKPRFSHGAETPLPGGGTLLGSYHVSQQNTFTGRLTEPMLDAVFLRARELASDPARSVDRVRSRGEDPSMSTAPTAAAVAMRRVAAAAQLRCVLVVEGDSDRGALEMLAARLGRDLETEGVAILPLGGATNLGHLLHEVARAHAHLRVAGLCDADQERAFRRQLEAAGLGEDLDRDGMEELGFFVCDVDLEDELIRALGIDEVLEVISAQGEHATFETFRKQPAQRGRAVDAQLRRFIGTRAGRKLRYARAMVEALDPACVPRPLAAVLANVP